MDVDTLIAYWKAKAKTGDLLDKNFSANCMETAQALRQLQSLREENRFEVEARERLAELFELTKEVPDNTAVMSMAYVRITRLTEENERLREGAHSKQAHNELVEQIASLVDRFGADGETIRDQFISE